MARDDWTWFSKGAGTTYDVLEDTDALSGAAISIDPTAGGGEVEIYRINTDPSNLIGVAKKIVFEHNEPKPSNKSDKSGEIVKVQSATSEATTALNGNAYGSSSIQVFKYMVG